MKKENEITLILKRKYKRAVSCCLLTALILLCVQPAPHAKAVITSSSLTNAVIEEKQSQIKDVEKQKNELKSKITDIKSVRKKLESAKNDLANYVKELDANLVEIQDNIADLNAQIEEKEAEIEETQAELDEALETEKQQFAAMVYRMRVMYEQGDSYMLEQIFAAQSLHDMLNQADYIESVVSYDKMKYQEFKKLREYIEVIKQQLDAEKELLDETKETLKEEEESLQELIKEKNSQISAYNSQIASASSEIAAYEGEMSAADEEIRILEAAIAEEKKALIAAAGAVIKYDGGMFTFPIASYTRISDDYGYRIHPLTGKRTMHNGLDLAAPYGTAIYAAYSGTVIAASYSSSMGNYVMIDHGDTLYTIYMHASSLNVSKGDIVVAGEKIAAVGSTGNSTGNHLHFGVRRNGNYVSPWDYLK